MLRTVTAADVRRGGTFAWLVRIRLRQKFGASGASCLRLCRRGEPLVGLIGCRRFGEINRR
jgi:hypothetical protein